MRKSRKNEIYETAMALFQNRGYESVTVMDICEACGITKKAFYYHYASKDELLIQYYDVLCSSFDWEELKRLEECPDSGYPDLIWRYEEYLIDGVIHLLSKNGHAFIQYQITHYASIFSPYSEGPYSLQFKQDEYIDLIARGQKAKQIRSDKPAQELFFVLFSAIMGIISHWCCTNGAYDLKTEIRRIFDFVMLPYPVAKEEHL